MVFPAPKKPVIMVTGILFFCAICTYEWVQRIPIRWLEKTRIGIRVTQILQTNLRLQLVALALIRNEHILHHLLP